MQKYTLSRKLVKIESVDIEAQDWEEAKKKLESFNNQEIDDDHCIENGSSTIEYTGDC